MPNSTSSPEGDSSSQRAPALGPLTRRKFIGTAALAALTGVLAACGGGAAPAASTAAPASASVSAAAKASPAAATSAAAAASGASGGIKVGVLNSLSGTMAISEVAVKNAS